MRRRRWIVAVILLAIALVAAACSGRSPSRSTTSSPTSPPTPTGAEPPPAWRAIAEAPIAGRIGAGVVWTGEEMIVWGGISRTGDIQVEADGAAYDPAADTWRRIAPAPLGVLGDVGTGAAWTGTTAVFWAGNSPDGQAAGGVYDPATDSWVRLPDGPLGPREGYVSVWTGIELLILGGTSGDGFAQPVAAGVAPDTGSWRLLAGLKELGAFIPTGAVWAGDRVYIAGTRYLCPEAGSSCTESTPVFLAYDPSTDRFDEIDLSGAPLDERGASSLAPVGWVDDRVVLSTTDGVPAAIVLYDPAADEWHRAAEPPCAAEGDGYEQTAWLGDAFAAPCDENRLQVYVVGSDTWAVIEAGRSPLNARAGSAIVWTGSDLIAWSGTVRRTGNPTPGTGSAISLST